MDEIEKSIKNNTDLNEANLTKYQYKLKALNEYIERCRELAPEISFNESEGKLSGYFIRAIQC